MNNFELKLLSRELYNLENFSVLSVFKNTKLIDEPDTTSFIILLEYKETHFNIPINMYLSDMNGNKLDYTTLSSETKSHIDKFTFFIDTFLFEDYSDLQYTGLADYYNRLTQLIQDQSSILLENYPKHYPFQTSASSDFTIFNRVKNLVISGHYQKFSALKIFNEVLFTDHFNPLAHFYNNAIAKEDTKFLYF